MICGLEMGINVRFLGNYFFRRIKIDKSVADLDIVRENGTYVECSFDIRVIG